MPASHDDGEAAAEVADSSLTSNNPWPALGDAAFSAPLPVILRRFPGRASAGCSSSSSLSPLRSASCIFRDLLKKSSFVFVS